jgi:hypothetical protein
VSVRLEGGQSCPQPPLQAARSIASYATANEPVLTAANAIYNGTGLLTLPELLEAVEWVCADTAQWMKAQLRYAEAERILGEVAAMKLSL